MPETPPRTRGSPIAEHVRVRVQSALISRRDSALIHRDVRDASVPTVDVLGQLSSAEVHTLLDEVQGPPFSERHEGLPASIPRPWRRAPLWSRPHPSGVGKLIRDWAPVLSSGDISQDIERARAALLDLRPPSGNELRRFKPGRR